MAGGREIPAGWPLPEEDLGTIAYQYYALEKMIDGAKRAGDIKAVRAFKHLRDQLFAVLAWHAERMPGFPDT